MLNSSFEKTRLALGPPDWYNSCVSHRGFAERVHGVASHEQRADGAWVGR